MNKSTNTDEQQQEEGSFQQVRAGFLEFSHAHRGLAVAVMLKKVLPPMQRVWIKIAVSASSPR